MATHFGPMGLVLLHILSFFAVDILVTGNATGAVLHIIAVGIGCGVAVHLFPGMAVPAMHPALFVMHIHLALLVLAEILISHAAAVTCRAHLFHGRLLVKHMAV